MRFVRAGVVMIFILSLVIFGVTRVVLSQNRDSNEPEIVSDRETLEIPCE